MILQGVPIREGRALGRAVLGPREPTGSEGGRPAGPKVLVALDAPPFGRAPKNWVAYILERSPTGPVPAVPVVSGLEADLFEPGDRVEVRGDDGAVDLPDVESVEVVTSFLQTPDGKVLLLRRSQKVGSFRGVWAGVSGFLEDPTPEGQARREISEETGLGPDDLTLVRTAPPVLARGGPRMFVVHPFRFLVATPRVRLDWEHDAFEWVHPGEIGRRATVPRLDRVWRAVEGNDKNR